MKKVLIAIVIIVLVIILTFLFLFKKEKDINEEKTDYSEEIEQYISQIYGNMFIVPEFNDINNADENWLWDNLISYITKTKQQASIMYTKEELDNYAKELYGRQLVKKFPSEGTESILFDNKTDKYVLGGYGSRYISNFSIISNVNISKDTYEVVIIEYKIDTFGVLKDYEEFGEGSAYDLYNLDEKFIEQFDSSYNNILQRIKKYSKENSEQFNKKKIIIKLDNEKFYISSCASVI